MILPTPINVNEIGRHASSGERSEGPRASAFGLLLALRCLQVNQIHLQQLALFLPVLEFRLCKWIGTAPSVKAVYARVTQSYIVTSPTRAASSVSCRQAMTLSGTHAFFRSCVILLIFRSSKAICRRVRRKPNDV